MRSSDVADRRWTKHKVITEFGQPTWDFGMSPILVTVEFGRKKLERLSGSLVEEVALYKVVEDLELRDAGERQYNILSSEHAPIAAVRTDVGKSSAP